MAQIATIRRRFAAAVQYLTLSWSAPVSRAQPCSLILLCGLLVGCNPADPFGERAAAEQEALAKLSAETRLLLSERYLASNRWPQAAEDINYSDEPGPLVDVAIGQNGVVTFTLGPGSVFRGARMVLTPSSPEAGTVRWHCRTEGLPASAFKGCE